MDGEELGRGGEGGWKRKEGEGEGCMSLSMLVWRKDDMPFSILTY